jgi:hypothetical protein
MSSSILLEEGGYPDNLFVESNESKELLKCIICTFVMKDALKSCKNDHLYCRSCLEKHVSVNGRTCPECREKIPAKADSARLANNLISELRVRCINSIAPADTAEQMPSKKKARSSSSSTYTASGTFDFSASSIHCSWTGALKDLDSHFTVCGFTVTKCSYDGCNIRMERRKLGHHEAICSHRLVNCEYCATPVKFASMDFHKCVSCLKRPVSCPNGCKATMAFDAVAAHKAICILELVDCPWKDLNACVHRCAREDMITHTQDVAAHMPGFAQALRELKTDNRELKTAITKLETHNRKLDVALTALKTDNRKLDVELTALNTQLKEVQNKVEFAWGIPNFDVAKAQYTSSEFQAFGHTLVLFFQKQENDHLFVVGLRMKTRVPGWLGSIFTVGRHNAAGDARHVGRHNAAGDARHVVWTWACKKMVQSANLTADKLLTPKGTLQIKAVVYKEIP